MTLVCCEGGPVSYSCKKCGKWTNTAEQGPEFDQQPSTEDEIRSYYDSHLNITLIELSDITGRGVSELKTILTEGD